MNFLRTKLARLAPTALINDLVHWDARASRQQRSSCGWVMAQDCSGLGHRQIVKQIQ